MLILVSLMKKSLSDTIIIFCYLLTYLPPPLLLLLLLLLLYLCLYLYESGVLNALSLLNRA